jgi:hypothetical protein
VTVAERIAALERSPIQRRISARREIAEWRKWFAVAGSGWDEVDDIERELGRTENDGADGALAQDGGNATVKAAAEVGVETGRIRCDGCKRTVSIVTVVDGHRLCWECIEP